MQFKNHRDVDHRVTMIDGQVILFAAGEQRNVPEALEQICIEAGLTPVEEKKPSAKATAKAE